jgi:sugar phosphate isomerase/epimerase
MNTFSISTVWNLARHQDVKELVAEVKALGFARLELNYKVSHAQFAEFKQCVREGLISIDSVHNYCPFPAESTVETANPDVPDLASHDELTRRRAVEYTVRSICAAHDIGAHVLVLHCGKIRAEPLTYALIDLYKAQGPDSGEFKNLRDQAIDQRRLNAKEHFDALCTSISELGEIAQKYGIILGLENRFHYRELPAPPEMRQLLTYFGTAGVKYWHDVGHAYVLEKLGFYQPFEYLGSFHKNMAGMHLHDIIGLKDHHAPCSGDFDWARLRRYDFSDVLKVFEVHSSSSPEAIKHGVRCLNEHVFIPQ